MASSVRLLVVMSCVAGLLVTAHAAPPRNDSEKACLMENLLNGYPHEKVASAALISLARLLIAKNEFVKLQKILSDRLHARYCQAVIDEPSKYESEDAKLAAEQNILFRNVVSLALYTLPTWSKDLAKTMREAHQTPNHNLSLIINEMIIAKLPTEGILDRVKANLTDSLLNLNWILGFNSTHYSEGDLIHRQPQDPVDRKKLLALSTGLEAAIKLEVSNEELIGFVRKLKAEMQEFPSSYKLDAVQSKLLKKRVDSYLTKFSCSTSLEGSNEKDAVGESN